MDSKYPAKPTAGEHSYRVRLYGVEKEKEVLKDLEDGRINVDRDSTSNGVKVRLECPSRVGLGEEFKCVVYVMNNDSKTIKVQLNNMTLYGRVTYEDADINYKRSEQLKGIFYLSAFKEVPRIRLGRFL